MLSGLSVSLKLCFELEFKQMIVTWCLLRENVAINRHNKVNAANVSAIDLCVDMWLMAESNVDVNLFHLHYDILILSVDHCCNTN